MAGLVPATRAFAQETRVRGIRQRLTSAQSAAASAKASGVSGS